MVPPQEDMDLRMSGRIAAIADLGPLEFLVDGRAELTTRPLEPAMPSITVGAYVRPVRNLKIGAFYRLQSGVRHDDDWIDLHPGWAWVDTQDRLEHLVMVDVSPRVLLGFLPGRNWVLMLKSRYILNSYNMHHSILLRPGLSYFLMRNREPVLTLTAAYGLYLALNFSERVVYEHAPYMTVTYHTADWLKLEFTGAYRSVVWSTSTDVLALGESYDLPARSFVFGVGVVLVP